MALTQEEHAFILGQAKANAAHGMPKLMALSNCSDPEGLDMLYTKYGDSLFNELNDQQVNPIGLIPTQFLFHSVEMLKAAHELYNIDISAQNPEGVNVVLEAAAVGKTEIIEYAIEHGMDINHTDVHGQNALHTMAIDHVPNDKSRNCCKAMEYVILQGIDLNAQVSGGEYAGQTALEIAEKKGHQDLVKIIKTAILRPFSKKIQSLQSSDKEENKLDVLFDDMETVDTLRTAIKHGGPDSVFNRLKTLQGPEDQRTPLEAIQETAIKQNKHDIVEIIEDALLQKYDAKTTDLISGDRGKGLAELFNDIDADTLKTVLKHRKLGKVLDDLNRLRGHEDSRSVLTTIEHTGRPDIAKIMEDALSQAYYTQIVDVQNSDRSDKLGELFRNVDADVMREVVKHDGANTFLETLRELKGKKDSRSLPAIAQQDGSHNLSGVIEDALLQRFEFLSGRKKDDGQSTLLALISNHRIDTDMLEVVMKYKKDDLLEALEKPKEKYTLWEKVKTNVGTLFGRGTKIYASETIDKPIIQNAAYLTQAMKDQILLEQYDESLKNIKEADPENSLNNFKPFLQQQDVQMLSVIMKYRGTHFLLEGYEKPKADYTLRERLQASVSSIIGKDFKVYENAKIKADSYDILCNMDRSPAGLKFGVEELGLDINAKSRSSGKNIAMHAAEYGALASVKEAVGAGVDIHHIDNEGNNIMHVIAQHHNASSNRDLKSIMQYALDRGVKLDVKNWDGKTPLEIAKEANKLDIVEIIEENTKQGSQQKMRGQSKHNEVAQSEERQQMQHTEQEHGNPEKRNDSGKEKETHREPENGREARENAEASKSVNSGHHTNYVERLNEERRQAASMDKSMKR